MNATTIAQAQTSRRLTVMAEINRQMDRANKTQEACKAPPIESVAGAQEPARLAHIEALIGQLRGTVVMGETNPTILHALGVQIIAWSIACEERDETRMP
jgi:hypothetical protein